MIYYFYNPQNSFFFPKCPFKYFTGYSCPGCGSQRAIHELLHFNIVGAFKNNALLILSMPYLLTGVAFNLNEVKDKYPKTRNFLFGQKAIFVVLFVVISFSILRNI